jgi:diacylglycerol kinase
MTKYKKQNFSNTFKNARKGVRLTLKSERNLRVHLFTAVLVIITALVLKFSIIKICIILLTISAVISAEMFNSAIEFSLDAIFHNKYSKMVGMAKDIAAGAVMIVTVCAVLIGVLLFVPPVYKILTSLL